MSGLPHYYGDPAGRGSEKALHPSAPRWPLVLGILLMSLPLLMGLATIFTNIEDSELSDDGVPVIPGTPRMVELGSFHTGDVIKLHFSSGSPIDVTIDTLANCQIYRDSYTYAGSGEHAEPTLTASVSADISFTVPQDGSYAIIFDDKTTSATTVDYHATYPARNLTKLFIWSGVSLFAGAGLIGIYAFSHQRMHQLQPMSERNSSSAIEHVIIEGKNDDAEELWGRNARGRSRKRRSRKR